MAHRTRLKTVVTAFLLAAFPAGAAFAGGIVYVTADSTGDYVCDGVNDEVEINAALALADTSAAVDTVHLRGPAVFIIDSTIVIGGGTTLTGDSTAVLRLCDNANWGKNVNIIENRRAGDRDIVIRGFEIDGNDPNNRDMDEAAGKIRYTGSYWYNIFHFTGVKNIHVSGMYLHNNLNDGLKLTGCDSIFYHDNRIRQLGHDALYAIKCTNILAYNNTIQCRTNSALRLYQSNHAKLYGNTIFSRSEGGCGIEIQKYGKDSPMNDIEVYENTIYTTVLAGMWLFSQGGGYSPSDAFVSIHHNTFSSCGTGSNRGGGIATSGFDLLVENNVFEMCYNTGIFVADAQGDSLGGRMVTLRNNIISNSRTPAYAVWNTGSATTAVVMENNCLSNHAENYHGAGITHSGDNYGYPFFADTKTRDYHLMSTAGRWDGKAWVTDMLDSPCIDAGFKWSAYDREPSPNGGRINIGRYGNTPEASKSGRRGFHFFK